MRYLKRRSKSAISGTGFKTGFCLLLVWITMLTAVLPSEMRRFWYTADMEIPVTVGTLMEEGISAISKRVDKVIGQQIKTAPTLGENEQFTLKGKGFERIAEITARGFYGSPRVLRSIRIQALPLAALFSEKPQRFKCFFSQGSRKQRELVSRSRQIVDFMCKADGKKNGISSFIR